MRTVTLYWRPRLPAKRRAEVLRFIREEYDWVHSTKDAVTIVTSERDTKYVWIFRMSKAFRDIVS